MLYDKQQRTWPHVLSHSHIKLNLLLAIEAHFWTIYLGNTLAKTMLIIWQFIRVLSVVDFSMVCF